MKYKYTVVVNGVAKFSANTYDEIMTYCTNCNFNGALVEIFTEYGLPNEMLVEEV